MRVSRTVGLASAVTVVAAGGAVGGYLAAVPQVDTTPQADVRPVHAAPAPVPFGPVLPADHSLATPPSRPAPVHTVTVTRVVTVPAPAPPRREHDHRDRWQRDGHHDRWGGGDDHHRWGGWGR